MIRIITDSTSDLNKDILQRYNIDVIPLYVRMDASEYMDGVNITPEDIYKWSDKTGETPKTAAPSVGDIMQTLKKHLDKGDEAVVFTISSEMSACYSNACMAVEELEAQDRVKVIDSANLSTGIGHLVVEAAIMAEKGKTLDEIEEEILRLRPLVRASFVVDTLVFLYRGGRCSGLAAMIGGALKMHPRIAVADGVMKPGQKFRGLPKRYVMDYVKAMEPELKKARTGRVFITHSGCDKEIVATVKAYLYGLNHFNEIIETRAGSVISSHCGPGTLGVLFIEGE